MKEHLTSGGADQRCFSAATAPSIFLRYPAFMRDLLASAKKEAESAKVSVRAAALLRIARVEMAFDRSVARITFNRGLDAIRILSGIDGEFLLEQTALLAAAVAPELLTRGTQLHPPRGLERRPFEIMLDHGHEEEAILHLYSASETDPIGADPAMLREASQEMRLALLRKAIAMWRNSPPYDRTIALDRGFIRFFQSQWRVLPQEEALAVLREIVRTIFDQPDQLMSFGWNDVEFTSWREHMLFSILDVLNRLDHVLAQSLIAAHEQLASAARHYPNGIESIKERVEAGNQSAPHAAQNRRPLYPESFERCLREGDYGPPFEYALTKYRQDSNPYYPNRAPKEVWPSTSCFRDVLYEVGKRLGRDGDVYLERIPDRDLRLFAQIELAAALAGLPKFRETERGCWADIRSPGFRTTA